MTGMVGKERGAGGVVRVRARVRPIKRTASIFSLWPTADAFSLICEARCAVLFLAYCNSNANSWRRVRRHTFVERLSW